MARNEYKDWCGFGSRVRLNREKLGLTREKLAEMINRSENYLICLEKGDKSCSVHTVYQLSNALRVSTDELLYGDIMEQKELKDKEIISNIINKCNEKELEIIKDILITLFPHFKDIVKQQGR